MLLHCLGLSHLSRLLLYRLSPSSNDVGGECWMTVVSLCLIQNNANTAEEPKKENLTSPLVPCFEMSFLACLCLCFCQCQRKLPFQWIMQQCILQKVFSIQHVFKHFFHIWLNLEQAISTWSSATWSVATQHSTLLSGEQQNCIS